MMIVIVALDTDEGIFNEVSTKAETHYFGGSQRLYYITDNLLCHSAKVIAGFSVEKPQLTHS